VQHGARWWPPCQDSISLCEFGRQALAASLRPGRPGAADRAHFRALRSIGVSVGSTLLGRPEGQSTRRKKRTRRITGERLESVWARRIAAGTGRVPPRCGTLAAGLGPIRTSSAPKTRHVSGASAIIDRADVIPARDRGGQRSDRAKCGACPSILANFLLIGLDRGGAGVPVVGRRPV